jgi:hydroxymethylpyrimidine/phosphomethylpyrimidine kinase
MVRTALTIAGSDSGGGAGIQADLKAFARCAVHGTSAITAITAQNTVGVESILAIAPQTILAQVRAVSTDMRIDAVKVGMLGTLETVRAVAQALDELPGEIPVVVDPVMVAESGARLLDAGAHDALVELILPRASVITPNLPEARVLGGRVGERATAGTAGTAEGAAQDEEVRELAHELLALGPRTVVITGGHRERPVDAFLTSDGAQEVIEIAGERHADGAAHGSGCTHSSLLAAHLALGRTPLQAARAARELTADAVRDGLREVGAGAGPVDVLASLRALAEAGGA